MTPHATARITNQDVWIAFITYLEKQGIPNWFAAQEHVGTPNHHVHIYMKDVASQVDALRKVAARATKSLKLDKNANKYYSVKVCDDQFERYCADEKNFIAYRGYTIEQLNAIPPWKNILPVIADATPVAAPPIVHRKPRGMRDKFKDHLIISGWKEDAEFTVQNVETEQDLRNCVDRVTRELTRFWKNAFTVPEGERMVRNALYIFGDDEVKARMEKNNSALFLRKIFPEYR